MNLHPPGTLIAGRYEVAGRPLLGGMGIVYLCLDHQTQRPVALKTFRPEFLPDRATRDRFLREGTTWINLGSHPHIVRAYSVERIGDGREVYLVLELVAKEEGRRDASLRSWLTPGKPLPLDQALLFTLQIVRGMKRATETIPGLVHRDLKPENVLVGADRLSTANINRVRITDFGLVAVLQKAGKPLSSSNEDALGGGTLSRTQLTRGIVGTPLYMAPEQWVGGEVTVQTDIYALGCILYEMLAGQHAIAGDSLTELERAHRDGHVRALPSSVPQLVGEIIARCLALEARTRYGSWSEPESALAMAYVEAARQAAPEPEWAQAVERADRVAHGWAHNSIGLSFSDIGKSRVAISYFEHARDTGRLEGDQGLETAALGNLGLVYTDLGDMTRAIELHKESLLLSRKNRDLHGEGVALSGLANACIPLGQAREALAFYEEALTLLRKTEDQSGEGKTLGNMGVAYMRLGDVKRAIELFRQQLLIAHEIGHQDDESAALGNLGNAYFQLGQARPAIMFLEQCLQIAREIGDRRREGATLTKLGSAFAILLGDSRRAIGCFDQLLIISREIESWEGQANALMGLGLAYKVSGDAGQAIKYYEQALGVYRRIGDQHNEGTVLGNLGSANFELGNVQQAIDFYRQALMVQRETGDMAGEARDSFRLAQALFQQGRPDDAKSYAEWALRYYAEIGHTAYLQLAQELVAQIKAVLP